MIDAKPESPCTNHGFSGVSPILARKIRFTKNVKPFILGATGSDSTSTVP